MLLPQYLLKFHHFDILETYCSMLLQWIDRPFVHYLQYLKAIASLQLQKYDAVRYFMFYFYIS